MMEQHRTQAGLPVERKLDMEEMAKEVDELLAEPIPGLTRDDRMDEIEGESFLNFKKSMGM